MSTDSRYYTIEPEVAGELGSRTTLDATTHPPTVGNLHYELHGWLGDALLECFPCFLVTRPLGVALVRARLTGCRLDGVEVSATNDFLNDHPAGMPDLFWLRVDGAERQDDLGSTIAVGWSRRSGRWIFFGLMDSRTLTFARWTSRRIDQSRIADADQASYAPFHAKFFPARVCPVVEMLIPPGFFPISRGGHTAVSV
jgi:hypothetical protein